MASFHDMLIAPDDGIDDRKSVVSADLSQVMPAGCQAFASNLRGRIGEK